MYTQDGTNYYSLFGFSLGMPSPQQSLSSDSDNDELARGVRAILQNNGAEYEPVHVFSPASVVENSVRPQRRLNRKAKKELFCVFCYNNGEIGEAMTHRCKDEFFRVICPKLRRLACPTCGATGDKAHTIKYCPKKVPVTMEDTERLERLKKQNRR